MPATHRNTVDSSFTLNIDVATTIMGAAGLPPHPGMQGKDISRLYRRSEESKNWRDEFYYEYKLDSGLNMPMATALVRKDFKYIHWPQFAYEQLFDLKSDPFEQNDIANKTEYIDVLSEMRHRHKELEASAL
jgi:arylsulfatase